MNVEDKGRRLLTEGRLTVTWVRGGAAYRDDGTFAGMIAAKCKGDSGEIYDLGFDPRHGGEWRCTCMARGRCSHLVALQLVTVKPKEEAARET